MQERLRGFKENTSILEHLVEDGIDVEKWLEYDEERFLISGKKTMCRFRSRLRLQ